MSATPEPRILIVKAKGGFGNRILSAATGIILAKLTDRTAVIDWRDGEYLPAGMDAYPLLFDSPVALDVADFDGRVDVVPPIWAGHLKEHPTDIIHRHFPREHSNPFVYRKLSMNLNRPDDKSPIAVFWSYLPKLDRLRWQLRRSALLHDVRPTQAAKLALDEYFIPNLRVRSAVDDLFTRLAAPVIGVHIRYTDRKVSLGRIFRETDLLRKRMPAAPIFLATDNQAVQDQFRARYSEVVVIDKVLGDDHNSLHEHVILEDPLHEAENALIDMWALSRCDWLVHSRHSTFSVAAALIGGIPKSQQRDIDRLNPRVVLKRWIQRWA